MNCCHAVDWSALNLNCILVKDRLEYFTKTLSLKEFKGTVKSQTLESFTTTTTFAQIFAPSAVWISLPKVRASLPILGSSS